MFANFHPHTEVLRFRGVEYTLSGLPVQEDNLAWILSSAAGEAVAVDAPAAEPVLAYLRTRRLRLRTVLLTHTHPDHTAGLEALLRETGCPPPDFPPAGSRLLFGNLPCRALNTSGHSAADFSYHLPDLDICFCGDTLFAGGCGRMFEGPPPKMWESLLRLRSLPDATRLCMGHDYALDNFTFALQRFPGLDVFATRLAQALACRASRKIFAPVTVGAETRGNPMLMADHPEIGRELGLEGRSPVEIFTRIRELRNLF